MLAKQSKNEAKEEKDGFLGMLLGHLGASLLGNMPGFLMPLHPVKTFEIQKHYQIESKFNSRNNLPKIKNGVYVINLDEFKSIGTYDIGIYEIIYFDSFIVEHIPKEIKDLIVNKNIITNIYGIQTCDSILGGYFCIGFILFRVTGKSTSC